MAKHVEGETSSSWWLHEVLWFSTLYQDGMLIPIGPMGSYFLERAIKYGKHGLKSILAWKYPHWNFHYRNPLDLGLNPSSARSRSLLPYKRPRGAGQGCWSDGFFFWVSWDVHGVLMAFLCWYPALLKTPVRWLIGNFKHALIFSTPVGKRSYDHFWPLLDAWHNFWNWVTQAQTNWVPSHFSCPGSLVLCHGQKKVR
jgi:hypothetical protein